MAFKSNLYTTLFLSLHLLYILYVAKRLTAFNVLRVKVPFPKYCHIMIIQKSSLGISLIIAAMTIFFQESKKELHVQVQDIIHDPSQGLFFVIIGYSAWAIMY